MNRRARDEAWTVIGHLAEQIGPRPASSPAEAEAAVYVNARLRRSGMRPDTRELRVPLFRGDAYALLALLALLAALAGPWLPLPALLLVVWLILALIADSVGAPLPGPLPRRPSQNIIANRAIDRGESLRPRGPRWRVLLLAPLDSPPVRRDIGQLAAPTRRAAYARLALVATAAIPAALELARPGLGLFGLPAALPALALLAASLSRPAPTAGSDGGAGALAALLTAAARLDDLRRVELWAVAVGGAYASPVGVELIARRFPFPPGQTLAIALQQIERGQLVYVTRDGSFGTRPADPLLLRLAAQADSADTSIDAEPRPYFADDALTRPLVRAGLGTLTLIARPDQPAPDAALDPDLVERAVRLVIAIVRQLDDDPEAQLAGAKR